VDDLQLDRLRDRTLAAARESDIRRRRRHRAVAALGAAVAVALLTAGGLALAAPPPPAPLPPDEEYSLYESSVEAHWLDVLEEHPDAVRPDVEFVRFVTADEEAEVTFACLRAQGIPAVLDEHGVSTTVPIGSEEQYRVAWFACDVQYPLSPNEHLPYTEDELRHIYRYFVEQLTPCLEARGYDIATPPGFEEFRARWWTDDTWGPYVDVVEPDYEAFRAAEAACPPMPSDLRP
jgi:hypothetical protein